MKIIFIKNTFIIFILFTIHVISNAQSSWVDQFLPSFPPEINSVSAVNKNICWISGSLGSVYYTSNGGSSWINRSSGLFSGGNITCIVGKSDGLTAFCLVNAGNYGKIFKTSDTGISWTQIYSHYGSVLQSIKFYNISSAYVYGDPVNSKWRVLKTTNSGNTFDTLITAPSGSAGDTGYPNALEVIDLGVGFQKIWFGTNLAGVYYSTNSGVSWLFASTIGNQFIYTVKFIDANTGFCGGDFAYKTSNGGLSWVYQSNYPNTGSYKSFAGIWGFLWFCSGTKIYFSSNSGLSFSLQHTSSNNVSYTHMSFNITISDDILSTLSGWAVTNSLVVSNYNEENIGIKIISTEIPEYFQLYQNYPNPFNPVTKIKFSIPTEIRVQTLSASGKVKLIVYNILGREVATLVNDQLKPGTYEVEFPTPSLADRFFPSGIYFYRLTSDYHSETKRMILLK